MTELDKVDSLFEEHLGFLMTNGRNLKASTFEVESVSYRGKNVGSSYSCEDRGVDINDVRPLGAWNKNVFPTSKCQVAI